MTEVVIAGAARTPVGAFNGTLSSVAAHDLGTVAIVEALKRAGVAGAEVTEAIMGQILTAGAGQNPARQAAIAAGIPDSAALINCAGPACVPWPSAIRPFGWAMRPSWSRAVRKT